MAKATKRRDWTTAEEKELRRHAKAKTPVSKLSKTLKRTPGALRQKARNLGFSIGHQPRSKRRQRSR